MSTSKILSSLENSWNRDEILLKIKNGFGTDEIVDEFLTKNKVQIKELNTLLSPKDVNLLNQVEKLSKCESKLINKIKHLNYIENNKNNNITIQKKISLFNGIPSKTISSFMINWSNKFVVIALLAISAIALSKQAWA